jgi:moderate conductance mechanosensitive channel
MQNELGQFWGQANAFRSILILLGLLILSYWLSGFLAKLFVLIARRVAVRSDVVNDQDKKLQLRRIETYLSVSIAAIRAITVGVVAFYAWQVFSESATFTTAAIGASAFFIVLAGGTLGMILRDITAGSAMIIERWFNVGDFVRVEPFLDVTGVVERITLRSTKLRSLNGEVIWIHNQHMQSVKVTQSGLRTIAIDVFANNEQVAKALIQKAIDTIPVGTMTATEHPSIERSEKWGERLWMFTIVGKTPPGREWIMETYFVESLKELDAKRKGIKTFVRPPLVRYADPAAERSFKRAVKTN